MKTRKLTVPKPLQHLTQDQLGQVHSWFSRCTYAQMRDKIRDTFNIEISVQQLTRYYARFSQVNLFNTVLYTPLTPSDMAAIQNAQAIPEHINMARLKEQCLRVVKLPGIDAFDLKALHDIFTYEERFGWQQHRNDLDERIIDLRHRQLASRHKLHRRKEALNLRRQQLNQPNSA